MKKSGKIILTVLFLFLIAVCVLYFAVRSQFLPVSSVTESEEVRIEIPFGTTVYETAEILKENNLIKNKNAFYYSVRFPFILKVFFPGQDIGEFSLKSGIYRIAPNTGIIEIQKILSSAQTEFIVVSIPEGFTIKKIAALLEENRICSASDFIKTAMSKDSAESFNIPSETLEGYLFPDTYYLTAGMNAKDVADLMVNTFFEKTKSVENLSGKTPEELFETVTLASIVEREYRVADEAPLIASVFKNRLNHGIGLYSCATVEYILTEILDRPHPSVIKIEDTKIDNPYNTYLWAGLPPGPISNPGLVALDAACNPPKTNYYFFQVADASAGRHVFTTTFEEHKINHNLYTKN